MSSSPNSTPLRGRAALRWLRWIAAGALFLLTLIFAIGTVRIFRKDLPGASPGEGVSAAFGAAVTAAGAFFLVRPELRRWTLPEIQGWLKFHPLGQALVLYVASTILTLAAPAYALLPAFVAMCIFSGASAWTAATRPRWWPSAISALIGWVLLFVALMTTAEAIRTKSIGEGAMIFLLPMTAFPVLLFVSGGVHRWRAKRGATPIS